MATQIAATPVIKGMELSEEHLPMVGAFSCVETSEMLNIFIDQETVKIAVWYCFNNLT